VAIGRDEFNVEPSCVRSPTSLSWTDADVDGSDIRTAGCWTFFFVQMPLLIERGYNRYIRSNAALYKIHNKRKQEQY